MILKSGTIKQVEQYCKGKNVYIFGAGKRTEEFALQYGEFVSSTEISAIVDNNATMQGRAVSICDIEIPIVSVERFCQLVNPDAVLIITVYACEKIINQLHDMPEFNNLAYFVYGMINTEDIDEKLYNISIEWEFPLKNNIQLIPKKIHYCWFGRNELSELHTMCIESWKRLCPDYEIVCWNEDNYDVEKIPYMKDAYADKKWAFVSDYARLDVIEKYGGIYLDTDVEIIKSLDELLYEKGFCGFQTIDEINFGLGYGAEKNNVIVSTLRQYYDTLQWDGGDKSCPYYQTSALQEKGLKIDGRFQRLEDMTVFPAISFAAKSVRSHRIYKTKDTYGIHHFGASWCNMTDNDKLYRRLWDQINEDVR